RNVDLAVAARRTAGYTGADLATIVNEAALLAARRRRDQVGMAHFEEAIDRVMAGLERRSRLIGRREKAVVAVHECGHAMITSLVPHADPLHRVSVIPRGVGIGGMTLQLPREERGMMTRAELCDRVAVLLAGRCAEDIVFGDVSTGAAQDLQQATEIAYRMVAEYGMSDRIGPLSVARADRPLLMHERTTERALGDETAREIDVEVRRILLEQDERVRKLLGEHRRRLVALARVLRDRETLDAEAFANLMKAPLKRKAKANPAL
ncbi:MAG: cell division protein FtsH, partial [Planctomycetota bacterium]